MNGVPGPGAPARPTAGGRDPFVEERGPPYREPFQEAGNVERGGLRRRLVEKRAKRGDVAVERSGELDHGPVGPDPVAERVPQVLEGLPQGGTRLDFGRLSSWRYARRARALAPSGGVTGFPSLVARTGAPSRVRTKAGIQAQVSFRMNVPVPTGRASANHDVFTVPL